MKRNFLPPMVGISMSKAQFSFSTGLTPYKLRKLLTQHRGTLKRMGYSTYDKVLMPSVVLYLLDVTGLQIDIDLFAQTDPRTAAQMLQLAQR